MQEGPAADGADLAVAEVTQGKPRRAETPLSIPAKGTEAASDDDKPAAAPKSSL